MRWLLRTDLRSFYLLNATQFLGALNDNVYKLLVIYLLIHIKGPADAPTILSLAGAIFVIPFLLFSSTAGVLADRFSKRTIIVSMKGIECLVMLAGLAATYFESVWGSYLTLFLLSTHSAFFGPSKYGIIPELVEPKMVSKANGSMTSMTYFAIILGTFLASFIVDITNKNFVAESAFTICVAFLGLCFSLGIRKTPAQNSPKKISPLFLTEIYRTLRFAWNIPNLLPAIFGTSFFLFMGAFTQLNIIPFAMESLGLTETGGGYLFLATAVGIAAGSIIAGQISRDKVEPGISCICGFMLVIFLILLHVFSFSLVATILFLTLLGLFGGGYLVPFDAFIQMNAPDEKRGQVIAAANFFSFVGVLFAAFAIYFFSEQLELSASSGFLLMGLCTLVTHTLLTGRLGTLFFPFLAKRVLSRFRKLRVTSALPDGPSLIILESRSWWDAILLFSVIPNLRVITPDPLCRRFPFFNGWMKPFRIASVPTTLTPFLSQYKAEKAPLLLFLHKRKDAKAKANYFAAFFSRNKFAIYEAHGKKERLNRTYLGITVRQITVGFQSM